MSDELHPNSNYGGFSNLGTCSMFCFIKLLLENRCYPRPSAPASQQELSGVLLRYFEFLVADNAIEGIDARLALGWKECDWDELYPVALGLWAGDER